MDFDQRLVRRSRHTTTDRPPSEAVVRAVAETEGVDPAELRSLREVVEPAALDALFQEDARGTVTFEYHGYRVRTTATGQVSIADRNGYTPRPTTEASEDDSAGRDSLDACAHCGAAFERGVSYPVETRRGPDDEFDVYSFCNERCRAEWNTEQ